MELYHYGVKGMRWGVRRYQNKNGSLTNAGKKRYKAMNGDFVDKFLKKGNSDDDEYKMYNNVLNADRRLSRTSKHYTKLNREIDKSIQKIDNDPSYFTKKRMESQKGQR